MADETETQTDPEPDSTASRLDTMEEKINKIFGLLSRKNDDGGEDPPKRAEEGMSGEMREALTLLRKHENERQQAAADDHTRKLIEDSRPPERPPAEFRKPTEFMKWATPADRR